MLARTALILLDAKTNRHSLNALVAALETDPLYDPCELRLAPHERDVVTALNETLTARKRPVLGISFTTRQSPQVASLLARLSERFGSAWGQVVRVAGGPHPSADPAATLAQGFNVVVRGEGETALLAIVQAVAAGDSLQSLPGIALMIEGRLHANPGGPPVDLERFGTFPLRRRRVVGPIEITRGCPFVCGYCQTSHLLGTRPRHRSVETIARYAGVIRSRGMYDVRFVTPNAFGYGSPDGRQLNLAALEHLLVEVRRTIGNEGRMFFGTFPSEVRPEHVTPESVALVKRLANNDSLIIGAQTGSRRLLDACHRGHGVDEIVRAVEYTAAGGLKPHVDVIFGLPDETDDDVNETVVCLRELARLGAAIHAHTFMPLPQTAFAQRQPAPMTLSLQRLIAELTGKGTLYGEWRRQSGAGT